MFTETFSFNTLLLFTDFRFVSFFFFSFCSGRKKFTACARRDRHHSGNRRRVAYSGGVRQNGALLIRAIMIESRFRWAGLDRCDSKVNTHRTILLIEPSERYNEPEWMGTNNHSRCRIRGIMYLFRFCGLHVHSCFFRYTTHIDSSYTMSDSVPSSVNVQVILNFILPWKHLKRWMNA